MYQSFEESNLLVISSEAVAGLDQKKTTIVHMYFKIEKLTPVCFLPPKAPRKPSALSFEANLSYGYDFSIKMYRYIYDS